MQQKLGYPSQNHMGMGRKSHGYGNYTDEATWNMEVQAQLQSHNFHDESYSTDSSSFHKQQYPTGMPMKHGGAYATEQHSMSKHHGLGGKLGGGGNHGMFDSMSGGHGHGHGHGHGLGNGYGHGLGNGHGHGYGHAHGGGQKYPFGGTNGNAGHRFSNGGGMFNNHGGGHKDYVSEEYEYEAHNVEHAGGVTAKMDEKRYERHVGGGDAYYANPYGHNRKPLGYGHVGHKAEWTAKGV